MTLAELRKLVASRPMLDDCMEVKVWLPGSTISLEFNQGLFIGRPTKDGGMLLIEGNVDRGSVL